MKLFQSWTETFRHVDPNEDIRIAVIEGEIAEQDPGYTIRISSAEADRQYFGTDPQPPCQVQRLHPLPDNPDMLQDFKGQYLKHLEFLVAPVVQQNDGQLYIAYDEGIIKTECVFREVEDILDCDADAVALQSPDFDFRPSSLLDGHPPWSR